MASYFNLNKEQKRVVRLAMLKSDSANLKNTVRYLDFALNYIKKYGKDTNPPLTA